MICLDWSAKVEIITATHIHIPAIVQMYHFMYQNQDFKYQITSQNINTKWAACTRHVHCTHTALIFHAALNPFSKRCCVYYIEMWMWWGIFVSLSPSVLFNGSRETSFMDCNRKEATKTTMKMGAATENKTLIEVENCTYCEYLSRKYKVRQMWAIHFRSLLAILIVYDASVICSVYASHWKS